MDDITKTVKSRKNSDVLIDGASETVEHEFPSAVMAPVAASLMASMAYSLIQTVASSSVKTITGKGEEKNKKTDFFH